VVITYVPANPTASISSPADDLYFLKDAVATTSYSCSEGAGGPGIDTCADDNGSSDGSGVLDTSSVGPQSYTVTATSSDTLTGMDSISYTVVSLCAAGSYSATGDDRIGCTPCPKGRYSQTTGQVSCDPAPHDTYIDHTGATAPTPCPTGTHTRAIASIALTDCKVPRTGTPRVQLRGAVPTTGHVPAWIDWTTGTSSTGSPTFDEEVRLLTAAGWGPWTDVAVGVHQTKGPALLAVSTGYQFRVRAHIGSLVSVWTIGAARMPWTVLHSAGSVAYAGAWTTVGTGATSRRESTTPGSKAGVSVTGTSFGVKLSTGAGMATVRICVDPATFDKCVIVDLSTIPASTGRTIVVVDGLAAKPHTVVLTVISGTLDLASFQGFSAVP
jgi:hypothetical protein